MDDFFGGGDVEVPGLSAEERELLREQSRLLGVSEEALGAVLRDLGQFEAPSPELPRRTNRNLDRLAGATRFAGRRLLRGTTPGEREFGDFIDEVRDDGNIALREAVEGDFLSRTRDILAGNLPLNPALLADLEGREQLLREELIRDFGSESAARTSTGGIARLDDFEDDRLLALSGDLRAELALAASGATGQRASNRADSALLGELLRADAGLDLARLGLGSELIGRSAGIEFGRAGLEDPFRAARLNLSALGARGGVAGSIGQLGSFLNPALAALGGQRQLATQVAIDNANRPSPFGTIAGIGLGSVLGNPGLGATLGSTIGSRFFGGGSGGGVIDPSSLFSTTGGARPIDPRLFGVQ